MKIGLISDTHLRAGEPELWPEIAQIFAGVDLILHAGDIYESLVLDWLERIAPVIGVLGNGDVGLVDHRLDHHHILELGGARVGMVHGMWYPGGPPVAREIGRIFGPDAALDVLILGDTHVTWLDDSEGVLVVNPGSATYPNNLTFQRGTVGMLTIENGVPSAEIIALTGPLP